VDITEGNSRRGVLVLTNDLFLPKTNKNAISFDFHIGN